MSDFEWPTIQYTELPPALPDSPLATEYNFYRRVVGYLLAAGCEGKHVLIKGEEIIGIYKTHREAVDAGYERYLPQGFFIKEIQTREPVIRGPYWRPFWYPHIQKCKNAAPDVSQ